MDHSEGGLRSNGRYLTERVVCWSAREYGQPELRHGSLSDSCCQEVLRDLNYWGRDFSFQTDFRFFENKGNWYQIDQIWSKQA